MPYTLILLSGDYPLLDFTFWGKVCPSPPTPSPDVQ